MSKVINIHARTGADYQGDDLVSGDAGHAAGASMTFKSQATEGIAALFTRTVVSSPTVGVIALDGASTASAPVIELYNQAFVSCTTIQFTTGGTNGTGAIRVVYPNGNFGWIPVLPAAAVTAAARG